MTRPVAAGEKAPSRWEAAGSYYQVEAYWGTRREGPRAVAARCRGMLQAFASVHPSFGELHLRRRMERPIEDNTGLAASALDDEELERFIADNVKRNRDGSPAPEKGYVIGGWTGARNSSLSLNIMIHAGNRLPRFGFINQVSVSTQRLDEENAPFITWETHLKLMMALAIVWKATWCAAYPWDLQNINREAPYRFGRAWMSFLCGRLAHLVTPPDTISVQRAEGDGLLMIATKERFDARDPRHVLAADEIAHAMAPVNALPWPPDR